VFCSKTIVLICITLFSWGLFSKAFSMELCLESFSSCFCCSLFSFELEHAYTCSLCWLSCWYWLNFEDQILTEVWHLVTCSVMIQAVSQGCAVALYMWLIFRLLLLGLCSIKWDMARFERNCYFEVNVKRLLRETQGNHENPLLL